MIETSPVKMSRYLDASATTQVAEVWVQHRRPGSSS